MPARKKAAKKASSRAPTRSPLKDFCRSLPGVTEDVKWGDDHVFSVADKMFAAFNLDDEKQFGFKCDDEDFDRLTEMDGIIPAPYAARFGWVRVDRPRALKAAETRALIRKSYDLVFAKLPRKTQRAIEGE